MPIDRKKLTQMWIDASNAPELVLTPEMIEKLNASLAESDRLHQEYKRKQREFFGRCNCPGFCYFHTTYDI